MSHLKLSAFVAVMAAALAAFAASTAAATTLNLPAGYPISSEAEGTVILHASMGNIECGASKIEGSTANEGGSTETVKANLETLSFTSCNATVTTLTKGSLEIHTRETGIDSNGTLTSTGSEVTVEFLGFHCIFKTSSTDLGTLTGSETTGSSATLDVAASIPRTGGRSGAFCGSTAQWTGSYQVTSPSFLNVDSTGNLVVVHAITLKGGDNAANVPAKCVFKVATEVCEVTVENVSTESLKVFTPEITLFDSNKFQEIGGQVEKLPECKAEVVLPHGESCGKKLESTSKDDVGPGVGTFKSNWIFQGTNAEKVIRGQAVVLLEWIKK